MALTRFRLSFIQPGQPLSILTVVVAINLLGAFARDCGSDEFFDPHTSKCDPCGPICAAGDCSKVCPNYRNPTISPLTTTETATTTTATATVTTTENGLSTLALAMIATFAALFFLVVALLFIMAYLKFCRKKKNVCSREVTTKPIEETTKDSNPETIALTNGIENV